MTRHVSEAVEPNYWSLQMKIRQHALWIAAAGLCQLGGIFLIWLWFQGNSLGLAFIGAAFLIFSVAVIVCRPR